MVTQLLTQNRHGQAPKSAQMRLPITTSHLPLQQKPVSPFKSHLLTSLVTREEDQVIRDRWMRTFKWTHVAPVGIARGRAVEAKLSLAELNIMLAIGHAEETSEGEVKATCNLFPVPELFKKRRRLIKHTKTFNDFYGKDSLEGIKLLKAKELVATVHEGKYAICLDFEAWFDQHELSTEARPYFCFPSHGKWYRLTRMPMGMRTSVDVAHTATELLASFPMPKGVRCDVYVDNIRFLSDNREDVIDAAIRFVMRCRSLDVTINEVPPVQGPKDEADNPIYEDIRAAVTQLVHTRGEFLGVEFDYDTKTVRIGKKTQSKLVLMRELFNDSSATPTHRNFLAVFGILFYALQVTKGFEPHRFYALKEYSETARSLQKNPGLLETPYKCSPSRMVHIKKWIDDIVANEWHPVNATRCPQDADFILVTDASRTGWGAVLLDMKTGMLNTHHGLWNRQWTGSKHSAWSEPEGITRALLAFFPNGTDRSITVLSDSSTAVGAFTKGRSMKFEVNSAMERAGNAFSIWNITFHHIPGELNVDADALSRQEQLGDIAEVTARVRCLLLGIPPEGGPYSESHLQNYIKGGDPLCIRHNICDQASPQRKGHGSNRNVGIGGCVYPSMC